MYTHIQRRDYTPFNASNNNICVLKTGVHLLEFEIASPPYENTCIHACMYTYESNRFIILHGVVAITKNI